MDFKFVVSELETKRKSKLSPTNMRPREEKRKRQPSTNKAQYEQ